MKNYIFSTCKHSPVNLLNVDEVSYFVSDRLGVSLFNGDLIVNFTEHSGSRAASNVYDIPQLSKHMTNIPEEIVVAWNDYGKPPVKPSFWKALHSYVRKKYSTVCFHCEHGHGRTGTAISAMCIALMKMDVETAISYVRENYCSSAVESMSQVSYLIDLDVNLNSRTDLVKEDIISKFFIVQKFPLSDEENDLDFSAYVRMGK